ncbi:MAG: hypothetical protein ACLFO2_01895 [Candidatus Woesearchaeota archaeon]
MARKKRGFVVDEDSDHPVHERYAREGKRKEHWHGEEEDWDDDESEEE